MDTNKISAKDIVMDPFGNKLNHNYSVVNETSMNDIDIYPFFKQIKSQSLSDSAFLGYKSHW